MSGEEQKQEEQSQEQKERKTYEDKLKEKINDLDREINKIAEQIDRAKDARKQDLKRVLDEMKVKREQANERLAEIKSASAETWKSLKNRMDAAFDDIKKLKDRVLRK